MVRSHRLAVLVLLALPACETTPPEGVAATQEPAATPLEASSTGPAAGFTGLGERSRPVTTSIPEAQRLFDQGLAFLYAFNHDEAGRSFVRAAEADPSCAMAHWGVALANGPHINYPLVPPDRAEAATAAVERAAALAASGSEVERALVTALATRYASPQPEDRTPLDEAYAEAMIAVAERFPDDADVGALAAEALMDLHPWDLWTHEGDARPWTEPIVQRLEEVLGLDRDQPLALHLYIHAIEASSEPGRADAVADRLRDLMPGLGHLVHMPSHIDVRRGRWEEAITANAKAAEADRRYREASPDQGFYRLYMAHNHHMLAYAAMMTGQSARAVAAMDQLVAEIPEDWAIENAIFADGFLAMPFEVRMRFGLWDEILARPELPAAFPLTNALRHYARGVALAAKGEIEVARSEARQFAVARELVPEEATFGNNTAAAILDLAELLLQGEIEIQAGDATTGIETLRRAAAREDALAYDEPPGWIQPIRHALGAALLGAGRPAEAETAFRADLERLPRNGWGLWGLARSLELQDRAEEAAEVRASFDTVWANADLELSTSCLCLPGV